MKKLTLGLLLAVSTQAFAQNNELVFSGAVGNYRGYAGDHAKSGYIRDLHGFSRRVSLSYLRNISILQLGASIEHGQLEKNSFRIPWSNNPGAHISVEQSQTIGDPFLAANLLANICLVEEPCRLYAGVAAGWLTSKAQKVDYNTVEYALGGLSLGGQVGICFKPDKNFGISVGATFRTVDMSRSPVVPLTSSKDVTYYRRLNYTMLGVGIHYFFNYHRQSPKPTDS